MRKIAVALFVLVQAFAAAESPAAAALSAAPLAAAQAESAGLSAQGLQRLDDFLRASTDAHGYLGAVTLIARRGKVVELHAFGSRDLARSAPMQTDAIFRIYSMSKTITTVAALVLVEQGKFALDDALGKYLPEFAHSQVLIGGTADAPLLRPAARAITIHDLLTHSAGFATGGAGFEQATTLVERADLHGSASLQEYAQRLARVPLATDPGTRFGYDGMSIEVVARLIEVVSKTPFDRFVQTQVLAPLQMHDTAFRVPKERRSRIADIASSDAQGRLILADGRSAAQPGEMLNPYPSGAGGLYSTASDYARFCQMLLNGGTLDGTVILGRKTVASMLQNHLASGELPAPGLSEAEGFGLGGSVVIDASRRGRLTSSGAFGWSGAASTYYTIDPQQQLVAIVLLQYLPRNEGHDLPKISTMFYDLVYQALIP